MSNKKRKNKKVFVAMSGGVDSSVAAALLLKKGYDVVGVFMKNWSDSSFFKDARMCPWEEDQKDAKAVCKKLGIPFRVYNFEKEYRDKVVEYMIKGYKNGITPNPDVMCNKEIKFKVFLEKALADGADMIATGHYVRVKKKLLISSLRAERSNPENNIKNDFSKIKIFDFCNLSSFFKSEYQLLAGKDKNKDQSYFLWTLGQKELKYSLFPIGRYEKSEIRKLAEKYSLPTAKKKDSQGVCFVGDIDVFEFLKSEIPTHKGKILTEDGKEVGEHQGVEFYTIGQRHGIGSPGGGVAYYVVKKDAKNNILYVAKKDDEKLYENELLCAQISWVSEKEPKFTLKCKARIRYRQKLSECKVIKIDKNTLKVIFKEKQRAVAPGQSVVFYDGDVLLGGGVII